MFSIIQITEEKIDEYINVLQERYFWLKERNLDMWKIENLEKGELIERYENPIFYGAYENTECIGGFILLEKDIRYWPNYINDKSYYFHKFVISPKYGGKGYSDKVLEWVKKYGRQFDKNYIRLDYQKKRNYLRNMYIKNGFRDVREIKLNDGEILILGEYEIS
jgi:GNAT superfamily N-acetyltransferase